MLIQKAMDLISDLLQDDDENVELWFVCCVTTVIVLLTYLVLVGI
jgi:hypothetical protein